MKLSKPKQVVGGLILGVILIGIISSGSDDASAAKNAKAAEDKEIEAALQATTPKEEAKAIESASLTEVIEAPSKTIFEKPGDFRIAFNDFCKETGLSMRVGRPQVTEGEVNNTFKADVSPNISFIGTLNKADNSVKDVTMIGVGDGTAVSGANILIAMTSLIGTMEPSLDGDERVAVLKKLGVMTDEDVMNLNKKYDHNGLHYFISSSEQMGIWFGVSRK
jgi:hypothetical protein